MPTNQFAGFNYPHTIYTLPSPLGPAGVKKKREMRKVCGPYYTRKPNAIVKGPHPGGMFYLDSDFQPGRRWKWCDEIISVRHTGWYCDDYFHQTIRGIVISLSHGKFLAGWSMGEHMISEFGGELYDDERDAAYAADEMARAAAELQREYQEEHREEV